MRFTPIALAAVLALVTAAAGDELLIADFEQETYGDWQTEGEAFGPGPARGTLARQMPVTGYKGDGLVNSFHKGDRSTGTLTSPPFTIERAFITFLVGGGGYEGTTCMSLLVDGEVVRTATGDNTAPGGSEELAPAAWDVKDLHGREAVLQIVDGRTGGWGHINVDHIVQTDTQPEAAPVMATRRQEKEFTIENRYLVMPIQNQARGGKGTGLLQVFVDGEEVRHYNLRLAPSAEQADWYAFFTIDQYRGRRARVVAEKATDEGFALVRQADAIPGDDQF